MMKKMPHILSYRPLITQNLERQEGRQTDDEIGEWLHSQDNICIDGILRDYMDSYSSNLLSGVLLRIEPRTSWVLGKCSTS